MIKRTPSSANVLAVLPAVQAAVKAEIAQRLAAGEEIVSARSLGIVENTERSMGLPWSGGNLEERKSAA